MSDWTDLVSTEEPRDPGSKKRLRPGAARHYPGDSAFDRIARTVCRVGCIPRKELHESWEVAKRVRERMRGDRIVDMACGHGLVAYALAVIMPRVPEVIGVDRRLPPSADRMRAAFEAEWPELADRVTLHQADIRSIPLRSSDIVVCSHGCGTLTDRVLDVVIDAQATVAVLPCCSDHSRQDGAGLEGWLDTDLAIDVVRAMRLRDAGYKVLTKHIPEAITPKNRLLMGMRPQGSRTPRG